MTRFSLNKKCVAAVLAAFVFAPVLAQTAVAPAKPASAVPALAATVLPSIEGKTIDGAPFKLNALKGKVVLVMFWSPARALG